MSQERESTTERETERTENPDGSSTQRDTERESTTTDTGRGDEGRESGRAS